MRSLWGMEDEDGGGWLVAGGGKRSWKRRKGKTGSGMPSGSSLSQAEEEEREQ